jgi:hypothetical protein
MNLVRHDLGFSKTEKRFPMKGTCLSIYSRAVNSEAPLGEILGNYFPWCAEWEEELRKLFSAYVEAKQKQNVLDYEVSNCLLGCFLQCSRWNSKSPRFQGPSPQTTIAIPAVDAEALRELEGLQVAGTKGTKKHLGGKAPLKEGYSHGQREKLA